MDAEKRQAGSGSSPAGNSSPAAVPSGYGGASKAPVAPACKDLSQEVPAGKELAPEALSGSNVETQITRPCSGSSGSRRRPAPKAITENAMQLPSPGSLPVSGSKPSSSPKMVNGGKNKAAGRLPTVEAPPLAPMPASDTAPGPRGVDGTAQKDRPPVGKTLCDALCETLMSDANQGNPHCSISTEGDAAAEIRTKVFRIGAPLLRSTIPVSLGRTPAGYGGDVVQQSNVHGDCVEGEDEGVETVLSLSDTEFEDQGALSVTLDFPC